MEISKALNSEIENYFQDEFYYLFPLHILKKHRNEKSYVVRNEEGGIVGFAVNGMDWDSFEVSNYWIFSKTEEGFEKILNDIVIPQGISSFNFELKYSSNVKRIDTFILSIDEHYCLENLNEKDSELEIIQLSERNLPDFKISDELMNRIGSFKDFPHGCHFWGVIVSGEIVAIAEAFIKGSRFSSVQQVYVKESLRGKGLASKLVTYISKEILNDQMTPTYLVDSQNHSSIKVARKLGFEKHTEYGYAKKR